MRRKYGLVLWHAAMLCGCMLIAPKIGLAVLLGLCHGAEFVYYLRNYRYMPRFKDYSPFMVGFSNGILSVKATSYCCLDFYKLWGGEIRCLCRCTNRRYTLISPGFVNRQR